MNKPIIQIASVISSSYYSFLDILIEPPRVTNFI